MSWGQLWDQSDNVAVHTGKGIEFLDKYAALVRDRCNIEAEYAKNLRSLAKKYLPKGKAAKEAATEPEFSYETSFRGILGELQDVAGQHEMISERFRDGVLPEIAAKSREIKDQRKRHLAEATRLQSGLDASVEQMLKAQKAYHRAFKEAEASHYKYTKAEGNMDLSRADLKKAEQTAMAKAHQQEEAKSTYAHQLQQTNEAQRSHFTQHLPGVLENLRLMDETRIAHIQSLMHQCIQIEAAALPILSRCLDGMRKHADAISAPADSKAVLDRYHSGYAPRADFAFEDYGSPQSSHDSASLASNGATPAMVRGGGARKSAGITRNPSRTEKNRSKSVVDKIFGGKAKGGEEEREDFGQLPPSQRCKRLRERIGHFEQEIEIKTKAKDGLTKLAQCYTDQPNMGNLDEVSQSLKDTNRQIDLLTQQLAKFRAYLADAEGQMSTNGQGSARSPSTSLVSNGASSSPGKPQRSSLSEESVSSESSLGARGRLYPPVGGGSRVLGQPHPPGGNGAAPLARPGPEMGFADEGGSSGEYNEADDPDPVLGTATVLYAFEGTNEGTMAVAENEEVLLIEKDEGDGWTRIRKLRGPEEGFVPSTYLDPKWYPN